MKKEKKQCYTSIPQVSQRNRCNSSLISSQTDYTIVLDQYNSIQLIQTYKNESKSTWYRPQTTSPNLRGWISKLRRFSTKNWAEYLECREVKLTHPSLFANWFITCHQKISPKVFTLGNSTTSYLLLHSWFTLVKIPLTMVKLEKFEKIGKYQQTQKICPMRSAILPPNFMLFFTVRKVSKFAPR